MNKSVEDFQAFITPFLEDVPPAQGLDTRIADLGIDSLSVLEMLQAIEDEYGVTVDPDHLNEESTLRHIHERFIQ